MRPFTPPKTDGQPGGSTLLDRVLGMLQDTLASLSGAVTNDCLVTVSLAAGSDLPVSHGLGYAPVTVEVVSKNANADVWESSTANTRRAQVLLMRASAAVTVTLRLT